MDNSYKSYNCNQLNTENVGEQVKLIGWVNSIRDHGGLIFIDLRDAFGITQCVINHTNQDLLSLIHDLRIESVIQVSGAVVAREESTKNPNIATGLVEVLLDHLRIESLADILPFSVSTEDGAGEEIRLKYRFLDLRRPRMQSMLRTRSKVLQFLRNCMIEEDFIEVQTPLLTGSSPEGARDFLVPSRKHHGKFYALPQAPQIFKQLLMVGGLPKYFQIAPCFRDEDARADRTAGEFYQLDFEISFAKQEDVFKICEKVFYGLCKNFSNYSIQEGPFPIISYKESVEKYGTDKPDLRNPLELFEATEIFKGSDFTLFASLIDKGAKVIALPAPGAASQPRSFFDKLNDWARQNKQGGLGYISFTTEGPKGPIASKLSEEALAKLLGLGSLKTGDAVFFMCGTGSELTKFSGIARDKVGAELNLVESNVFKPLWVDRFPMFELDSNGKLDFSHNPFSMPIATLEELENADPLTIEAYQYDLVCNGVELCSGAIRNHHLPKLFKAFELVGYSKEEVQEKFGGLVKAFHYGPPPHGGAALGLDRILMLILNTTNIRDVIAFPLTQSGEDSLMQAPSSVEDERLRELGIRLAPTVMK